MAGEWLKIEVGLPDKPEVWEIAETLGIDPDSVTGKLVRVWAWASLNCNGDGVTSVTACALLDRCTGVSGFAEAMKNAGWLRVENGVLIFPNFDRHNGSTAKSRACANNRVKRFRNAQTVTTPLPEKRREDSTESKIPTGRKRFEPPTIEQITEYGATLNPPFTRAAAFLAYYESNGWRVGKNPMKSWQSAVRSWHAKDIEAGTKPKFFRNTIGSDDYTGDLPTAKLPT
jgi:hypothetical protein